MTTWNYRVFREENGDYVIREIFYDEEGCIVGCTEDTVEPVGSSLEELASDIECFREALEMPVLTVADVPCESKLMSKEERSAKISHEQLLNDLGLSQ